MGEGTRTNSHSPLGPPDKGHLPRGSGEAQQGLRGGAAGCPVCTTAGGEVETPASGLDE